MKNRIVLFCLWFGPLPPWHALFLLSCERNADVDFVLATDQDPGPLPPNVRIHRTQLRAFLDEVQRLLGVRLPWETPYKLCDLRIALGAVYGQAIAPYSHWGYIDMDVIFGRITRFYDEEVLSYDVISPRNWLLAGHFSLFRNTPEIRRLFTAIPEWKERLADTNYLHMDEIMLTQLIYGSIDHRELKQAPQSKVSFHLNGKPFRSLYREQYPTFLRPQLWKDGTFRMPGHWEWRDGVLTAPFLDNAEVLYLHFTHWCSGRWTTDRKAVWAGLPQIVAPELSRRPDGFSISAAGFQPLAGADAALG